MKLPRGVRRLFGAPRSAREVEAELEAHLEQRVEELLAAGVEPAAARARAEAEFGDLGRIGRECDALQRQIRRRARVRVAAASWWQDLRFAARTAASRPLFSLSVVAILAIGIGSASAVFAVVNTFFFKSVPGVHEPGRLIEITQGRNPDDYVSVSYPVIEALEEDAAGAGGTLAAVAGWDFLTVAIGRDAGGEPAVSMAMQVTGQYFSVLGTRPLLGRLLEPADVGLEGAAVTVLSERFWRRELEADPGVLGSALRFNGVPLTVVGVAESGFGGHAVGALFAAWVPIGAPVPGAHRAASLEGPRNGMLDVIARLAPGVAPEAAGEQVDAVADRTVQATEGPEAEYPLRALRYGAIPGPARTGLAVFLMVLLGIVGVVIAIICLNITNLQLARALDRRAEMAIRASLGAGRGRLVRQLLLETLLLFVAGAWAGGLLAQMALTSVGSGEMALPVPGLRIALDLDADWRVVGFVLGLTLAAGLLSGSVAALQATRGDLAAGLGERTHRGIGRFRLRQWLVGSQVAATVVLLVVSGLFARSLQEIGRRDLGFRSERVQVATVDLQFAGLGPEEGAVAWERILERVRALPTVESAALAHKLPISSRSQTMVAVPGVEPPEGQEGFVLSNRRVSPGYFETLSMTLLGGRVFDEGDRADAPGVIILNETMADRLWPDGSALGRRVYRGSVESGRPLEVVGVVRDGVYHGLDEPTPGFGFLPAAQNYDSTLILHLRLAPGATLSREDLRTALMQVVPGLPLLAYGSLDDSLRANFVAQQVAAWVSGVMGLAALILAAFGIYGITSFTVSRRTREMGVRMALGATPAGLRSWALRQGLGAPVAGLAAGLLVAFVASRAVAGLLVGVSGSDPATFLGVALLLALLCATATWLPTARASRLDPATTLRGQ